MTSTIARRAVPVDALMQQLRGELAEVLTPERLDRQRASELQAAITDVLERKARTVRMRRAVLTVAIGGDADRRSWWY